MTGISRPQNAFLKATQRSCQLAFGSLTRLTLRPSSSAAAMSAAPMMSPGMTPALKRSPMETPEAMEPYTTKVMEGGMMTPMAPALAMRAAEKLGL